MEVIAALISLLQNIPIPSVVSAFLGVVTIAVGLVLYHKKTDIESKTATSAIQRVQVESLMAQIELLSEELDKTRHQINELHTQNLSLMQQLRESNQRISELEASLSIYRTTTFQPGDMRSM